MKTTVSSRGQIVLPATVRSHLGIREGDELSIQVRENLIVLQTANVRGAKVRARKDEISGLPVLTAAKPAPVLTSRMVDEILHEFP